MTASGNGPEEGRATSVCAPKCALDAFLLLIMFFFFFNPDLKRKCLDLASKLHLARSASDDLLGQDKYDYKYS